MSALFRNLLVETTNPFTRPDHPSADTSLRRSVYASMAIHTAVLLLMVVLAYDNTAEPIVPQGDGDFVSVEMVVLAPPASLPETVQGLTEEAQISEPAHPAEIVEETLQPETSEPAETLQPSEEPEVVEHPDNQEHSASDNAEAEENPSSATPFVGVGSQGEAGSGAPGPASYEGRVFAAIRRGFRTAVQPPQTFQVVFTVNPDGSHFYEIVRTSGSSAFDRAVVFALDNARIPPVPPGRSVPVTIPIEFFGP